MTLLDNSERLLFLLRPWWMGSEGHLFPFLFRNLNVLPTLKTAQVYSEFNFKTLISHVKESSLNGSLLPNSLMSCKSCNALL